MRVAILVPMMSGRGGSETAVAGLVQGLQSLGDEAHVYLFGGLPKDPRWLEPLPYTVLGSPTEKRLRRFHRYIFGLAKEFKRFSPDAVVALDSLRLVKGKLALTLSGSNASLLSFIEFPVDQIRMNRLLKIEQSGGIGSIEWIMPLRFVIRSVQPDVNAAVLSQNNHVEVAQ